MNKMKKTILIYIPSFNAENTIDILILNILKIKRFDILLVDDCSRDGTYYKVKYLFGDKIKVIRNKVNGGYGYNQKVGYTFAIKNRYEYVLMIHGDMQYSPSFILPMIDKIRKSNADIVLGSRLRKGKPKEMPLWRYIGNRILTRIENSFLGLSLSEYHTGFRIFKVSKLKEIDFKKNYNGFLFDTEIICQLTNKDALFQEISIKTNYGRYARSINLRNSILYFLGTIILTMKYYIRRRIG